jgi:drug/metabolite transporter (DMT)-like permease
MKRRSLGIVLLVVTAVTLASSTLLMKYIPQLTSLSPGQIGILRFLIAAIPLWLIGLWHHSDREPVIRDILKFIGLGGVFSIAGFSALFALERLPASVYIIVVYIYPSLVVLYMLLTKGSVPRLFWLGLPLTLIGLFLVTFNFNASIVVDPVGILITILNATALTAYMILSGKVFRGVEKQKGTKYVLTGAMLAGLLMLPFTGFQLPGSLIGWALILSLGIIGTLVPILTMNIGLQYLGAARGSVIITVQPVVTVLFTTIFLGESLSLQQWFGGFLVVAAIIIIQLSSDRQQEKSSHVED